MSSLHVNRRRFLVSATAVDGGLALRFPFDPPPARSAAGAAEMNAWIAIHPDETVTIRVARSEMGQRVLTALAMLVAEELACDWARVTAEPDGARLSRAGA